jgi:5-histidylcysteine sulfoxide synthase
MGRSSKPQERVCYSVLASQDNRAHINCEITSKHRPELIANFLAESSGKVETNWFTGKRPIYGECPGVTSDGRLHSLPFLSLEGRKCTKRALQDYFDNTWTLTELLFSSLKGEKAFIKPPYHDLRHPMIFYYGHPAALYVNKLRVAGMLNEPINPYFEVIFETGVDEMSWDDLSKNQMKWPSVQEVHHYRKQVYNTICTLIGNLSDEECQNINQNSPLWSLVMSFEHERIHIETSSVLINEMPLQYLQPPGDAFPKYHPSAYEKINITDPAEGIHFPQNYMIEMKAQNVQLGKPKDHPSFGWDNEYGSKTVSIPSFKASAFKVSNGEYLEFVKDGGYQLPEYWSEKGWEWKTYRNAKWPTFWSPIGPQGLHQFHLRCLFDLIEMKWNWPVCVNYHEAEAFANWKAKKEGKPIRVSTELEYQAIRKADQASYSDDPVMDYSEKRNLAEVSVCL